jgi:DNA (cytosine-5)-methyltransferase 1
VKAVDLFAGWGGFTLGAEQAGAEVVWAANHWPTAVAAHAANHPRVEHVCQDLRQADWTSLPDFDLLLASPACQPHSRASQPARGARKHDAQRATAWAVTDCADATEPRAIVVENVADFMRWRLYPEWRATLVKLGYHVDERMEMATDFGVPQRRERLFIVATRRPISRLRPTRRGGEPAFGPCVDYAAPGWKLITMASPQAATRMRAAQARTGSHCLVQHVTGHPGVPLTEPIRTITTKDHWVLVHGDSYRVLTIRELARGMGFPDGYRWPAEVSRTATIRGLGGAVPPPMARGVIADVLEAA